MVELYINLYKTVLRKYQFSIDGMTDREKFIHDFFQDLSQHQFFSSPSNYSFLLGGFLRLENERQIEKWDPIPFDNVFYYSYHFADRERILSFHYYCLNRVSKDINVSYILSQIIISDIDFKVTINYKISIPTVSFSPSSRVLEINIPVTFINEKYINLSDLEFKSIFHKNFNDCEGYTCLVNEIEYYPNIFSINSFSSTNGNTMFYQSLFDCFINVSNWNEFMIELENQFHHINSVYKNIFNDNFEYWVRHLSNACMSLGFFSFYNQSTIEYLLSIGKIEQNKLRNLGGLMIGYNLSHTLSEPERVYLNIISDRITSIVANDYVNTNNSRFTVISKYWKDNEFKEQYLGKFNSSSWEEYDNKISSISIEIFSELKPKLNNINNLINYNKELEGQIINNPYIKVSKSSDLDSFLITRRIFLALYNIQNINILEHISFILSTNKAIPNRANNLSQNLHLTENKTILEKSLCFLPEEVRWLEHLKKNES